MITFLLLPFLLAIRVSVDVDSWYYGPEYIYRVNISMLAVDKTGVDRNRGYDVSTELKCRPRAPNILNCRFQKNPLDATSTDETISDFDMNELPFEVKFEHTGIRELVIEDSLRPWEIDMIRAIVNQLSVGFDGKNVRNGPMFIPEKSYLGWSRSKILVSLVPTDEQIPAENQDYEIISLDGRETARGVTIDIEKTRIIEESPRLQQYFFGSKEGYRDPPENLFTNIKSSMSRIVIRNTNFTSYTANEITVNRDGKKDVTLYERISVELASVAVAKFDLPPINRPVRASFAVHGYVGQDSSEESSQK